MLFIVRNIKYFLNLHSLIYGIKSIGYFLRADLNNFKDNQISFHCQFATQASIFGLLVKGYIKTNVSYSFTYHAYDIYVKNLWFNLLADNAENVFSISNYNLDYVYRNYNLKDESKLKYSPLGTFPPTPEKRKESNDFLSIGFLSYFVEMKGIRYLLQAINDLKKSNLQFVLYIAGDGPLRAEMLSYVEENDLKSNVVFYGLIKNEEKDNFFRKLDLFILPSVSNGIETDGLPVVLMEAVSYGLPIISTNISGIPEICVNDYNGYLIEEKNAQNILAAIFKFSENSIKWPFFSQNSLEISKKYNITTNSNIKLKMLGWN